jgi:TPR repeat protein
LSEQRKQLEATAAAQAEREKALHDREEALKQRARVARVRNIALVAVSILALLAVATTALSFWSYRQAQQDRIVAEQQNQRAEQQRTIAEQLLEGATSIIVKLQPQMDNDTQKQAFSLFETGAMLGHPRTMYNLGVVYEDGRGVTQDYAKAREWYEKAAA